MIMLSGFQMNSKISLKPRTQFIVGPAGFGHYSRILMKMYKYYQW